MNTLKNASPQILSGTVSLGPGDTQIITLDAMASRSRRWLQLREMSVALWPDPADPADVSSRSMLGSLVNIRARAYRQDLMLNYLPTWLIGPRLHLGAEFVQGSGQVTLANYGQFETYLWRFPQPFYMPPGTAFSVQLQRNGRALDVDVGGTVKAQVAVRAFQISEAEAKRLSNVNPIPYMSSYTPSTFPNKSNNLDLANPFLIPYFLQRMVGRIAPDYDDTNATGPAYGTGFGYTIQLSDTRTVICETSDLMQVFPATQMAWTSTRILQPNEYLTAELGQPPATIDFNDGFPQVSMIGYRNEDMP